MLNTKSNSIFVVDDNPASLFIYQTHLQSIGYSNVTCFEEAEQCISQLKFQQPDIIFIDYYMAPMDGMDALKIIKGLYPQICVVFVSGQEDTMIAINALKCGAYDYIIKNEIELQKISSVLDKILINKESPRDEKANTQPFSISNRWYNGYKKL